MVIKKKICIECGKETYIFSKGRCRYCTQKTYKKPSQITEKTKALKKEQSNVRDVYFNTLIPLCNKSEESGTLIYYPTRVNICHIFPKRTYKSVQANLDNHIFLTLDEHTRYDYLLDTFNFRALEKEFPKAWKITLQRVAKLLPFVEENKKLKIKFEEYLAQ